jgi:hypothetical protein
MYKNLLFYLGKWLKNAQKKNKKQPKKKRVDMLNIISNRLGIIWRNVRDVSKLCEVFCGMVVVMLVVHESEVSEALWEVGNGLCEFLPKVEVSDCGREVVNWLVEEDSKSEVGDTWRKVVNWLVENVAKSEVGDVRREKFYRIVEQVTECEVCEVAREVVDGLAELESEFEVSDVWGKEISYRLVEKIAKSQM